MIKAFASGRGISRFLIVIGVVCAACSSSPGEPTAGTLTIAGTPTIASVGSSVQLNATYVDAKGSADVTSTATWTSSASEVAVVSQGTVTGLKPGFAAISATHNGVLTTVEVTVGSGWRLRGRIVTALSRTPAAGANLLVEGVGQFNADAAGGFEIAADAEAPRKLSIFGGGFLPRELTLKPTSRSNLDLDVVSTAAPFNPDTYQKMVFDGYESPSRLSPLRRWITQPRFYIKTTIEGGGPNACNCSRLTERDVDEMQSIIKRAVPQFTGGAFSSVRVDSGPDEPSSTRDTIMIRMAADLGDDVLGQALVGSNPGMIYLLVIAPSSCTGYAFHPRALAHEVGHAFGFWHHNDAGIMRPKVRECSGSTDLSPVEGQAASVAYTRQPLTTYPDVAPPDMQLLDAAGLEPRIIVD